MATMADKIVEAFERIGMSGTQNAENLNPQQMINKAMASLSVSDLESQLLVARASEEVVQAKKDSEEITAENAIGTAKLKAAKKAAKDEADDKAKKDANGK